MPRTPAIQAYLDWNARAEHLRLEAAGRELALLAELGPAEYERQAREEDARQAYHYEEEDAHR